LALPRRARSHRIEFYLERRQALTAARLPGA